MGAHPAAPSEATVDGAVSPLNELVAAHPDRFLRNDRASDWFPFLFKILAIDAPLSIQVHPTPQQAVAGFEDEQARGIPVDAPHRNYKDRYSKPENVIALTPMKVLTGVRPQGELQELAEAFGTDWLSSRVQLSPKQLLTEIIRLPQDAADRAIAGLVNAAQKLMTQDGVSATVSDAADLVNLVAQKYPGDKGLLVAFVMNLMNLAPGDSAFTPDGQVHAYVSGTAIELMNPSDNVLRAGLTPKHIDTEELIKVLGEHQDAPVLQRPAANSSGVEQYAMWDERMSVQHIRVLADKPVEYTFEGTSAALVVEGSVTISVGEQNITLRGTESVLHAGDATSATITGEGEVYIARYV